MGEMDMDRAERSGTWTHTCTVRPNLTH